jgi:hypothetical protein
MTSCKTICKKNSEFFLKNQDSMGKTKFFLSTLSFSPWAVLATWLHVELLRKYRKNELNTCFEQNFTMGSYEVGIGRAWCSQKTCEIYSLHVQKKKLKKNYFSLHKLPK